MAYADLVLKLIRLRDDGDFELTINCGYQNNWEVTFWNKTTDAREERTGYELDELLEDIFKSL